MGVATTTALVGAGLGVYQMYKGAQQKKRAEEQLANYKRQELKNAYEDMRVSTLGSDLMREENARNMANSVDVLRNSGQRGILGGLPRLMNDTNNLNRQAQIELDNQMLARERAIADDNARLEQIKEARDIANIQALSSEINAGKQDLYQGLGTTITGLADASKEAKLYKIRDVNGNVVKETDGKPLRESYNDRQSRKRFYDIQEMANTFKNRQQDNFIQSNIPQNTSTITSTQNGYVPYFLSPNVGIGTYPLNGSQY